MKTLTYIIAFFAFAAVVAAQESGYTITPTGGATWENQYAALNVSQFTTSTPQTIDGERYYVQLVNLSWKATSSTVDVIFRFPRAVSGGIDVATGFTTKQRTVANCTVVFDSETNQTSDVCNPYEEDYLDYNWNDVTGSIEHRTHQSQHYYGFENVNLAQGAHRMARLRFPVSDLPNGEMLKWDFGVKLSSDTIADALSTGRYILLDPVIFGNFTDNFEDASINENLWKTYLPASGFTINEQNGVMNLSTNSATTGVSSFLWLQSPLNHLTNVSFTIQSVFKSGAASNPNIRLFDTANETGTSYILYQFSGSGTFCQGCQFYINRSSSGNISLFNATSNNMLASAVLDSENQTLAFSVGQSNGGAVSRLLIEDFTYTSLNSSQNDPVFYECSPNNGDEILEFYSRNENNPSEALTARVEAIISILNESNRQATSQYNFTLLDDTEYAVCMLNAKPLLIDVELSYNTTGGFTHRYYVLNESVNAGDPVEVYGYNYADTTGVSDLRGVVRESSTFNLVPKVYIALQRRYLTDGSWRTVQMDKTGDFGNFFFNIREEDTRYRFIFYNENATIIKSTDDMSFSCESAVCELTFLITDADASTARDYANFGVTYDNETRVVTLEWDDPEQETDTVTLVVTKETFSQSILICSTSSTQQSGTMTCNASAYAPPYYVAARREASPLVQEFNQVVGQATKELRDLIGNSAATAFYGFIIVVVTGTAALAAGPVAAALAVMAGIFGLFLMGLFNFLNVTIIIMLGIGTAFLAEKLQKK